MIFSRATGLVSQFDSAVTHSGFYLHYFKLRELRDWVSLSPWLWRCAQSTLLKYLHDLQSSDGARLSVWLCLCAQGQFVCFALSLCTGGVISIFALFFNE